MRYWEVFLKSEHLQRSKTVTNYNQLLRKAVQSVSRGISVAGITPVLHLELVLNLSSCLS